MAKDKNALPSRFKGKGKRHGRGIIRETTCGTFVAEFCYKGKQVRRAFKRREQAKEWLHQAEIMALNRLSPLNAVEEFDAKEALALLPDGVKLCDAVNHWLARNPQHDKSLLLDEAIDRFLKDKQDANLSPVSLRNLRQTLNNIDAFFPDRSLVSITADDLLRWMDERGYQATNRANRRRILSNFFGWCIKRGYTSINPVDGITVPRVEEKLPEVFTVDQVRDTMKAAQEVSPELVAYFAIGFFAGIRPTELTRLEWESITDTHIHVGGKVAKIRKQRYVEILPNLKEWLATCKSKKGRIAPLTPTELRNRVRKVRDAIGLKKWPKDITRHSFATYHLAKFQDAPRTSLELGHLKPDTLYNHYRALATKNDGIEFFQIIP